MMIRALAVFSVVATTFSWMPHAHAGGVEIPAAGTMALGRGGAYAARADDPMALYYNPANLADLPGLQLTLQSHLVFYSACFQRTGTYGEDSLGEDRASTGFDTPTAFGTYDDSFDRALPEVCNSGPPGPIPELILTWRATPQLGFGIGILAPAAAGHTIWGDDVRVGDRTYRGIVDGRPAPSRYNLVEEQLIIAFPTIGVGYAPHPRVRFGAAFSSGFGFFNFDTVTRAYAGEEWASDVFSELSATDKFIPRITASVHAVPHDNVDVMFGFTWTQDVSATGDLDLTSGYYLDNPVQTLSISGITLNAPQPWQMTLGVRYADRITPRTPDANAASALSGRIEDKMSNERWDIELNVVYERNSRVDRFTAEIPACTGGSAAGCDEGRQAWTVDVDELGAGLPPLPLPPDIILPHQWKDQLLIRVGGDYNIIPGMFAARLGFTYETRGVTEGFEQLDFLPFQRYGMHVGATLRLGNFDISVAYAYIHQQTVTVTEEQSSIRQVNADARYGEIDCAEDPSCDSNDPEMVYAEGTRTLFGNGTRINAGRYTSHFNLLSLGLTYHFY